MGSSCSCNGRWCHHMARMQEAARRRNVSRKSYAGRRPKFLQIRRKLRKCKCTTTQEPLSSSTENFTTDNQFGDVQRKCSKHVTFEDVHDDKSSNTKNHDVNELEGLRRIRNQGDECTSIVAYSNRSVQCPEKQDENECQCCLKNRNVYRFTIDAYFN